MKFKEKVLALPKNPSEEDVKLYLMWLACSKYHYHIDDDPTDILWTGDIGKKEVKVLIKNAERMWNKYSSLFLWENYPIIEVQECS